MDDVKMLKNDLHKVKILFVDDEEDIRKGTGSFFDKFFDDVFVCANGEEGIETFKKHNDIQVVITDIIMPKISGVEMIDTIKKINPNILVIYITASRGTTLTNSSEDDLYIKKPLSYDDMKSILFKIQEKV